MEDIITFTDHPGPPPTVSSGYGKWTKGTPLSLQLHSSYTDTAYHHTPHIYVVFWNWCCHMGKVRPSCVNCCSAVLLRAPTPYIFLVNTYISFVR